ncbi:MAG: class I tRNA ligase family protein, partial [Phycisphaerae bacterium]
ETIRQYHDCIENYQFSASVKTLRVFFWESLCDWYIELTKPRMAMPATDPAGASARQVLAFCLDQMLRLLHPTIPFITERLWQQLNALVEKRGIPGIVDLDAEELLVTAKFPPKEGYEAIDDLEVMATFSGLQFATRGVRDLRTKCDVPPKTAVEATVVLPAGQIEAFDANSHILKHMAGVDKLNISAEAKRPVNAGSVNVGGVRIYVHDISDDAAELKRTRKSLEGLEKQIKGKESKLGNEKFVNNANPEVVEAERERLAALRVEESSLREHLAELESSD